MTLPIKLKDPTGRPPKFTHQQKLEAAAMYYMKGVYTYAAKDCSFPISPDTIGNWHKYDPDFQNHVKQLVIDNEQESCVKYRSIIKRGLDEIEDRIINGNVKVEVIDKDVDENGNTIINTASYREPMSSKDLTYTVGITIDKYRVALGQPTNITDRRDSLDELSKKFQDICNEFKERTVSTEKKVIADQ